MLRYEVLIAREYATRQLLTRCQSVNDQEFNKLSNEQVSYLLKAVRTFKQRSLLLDRQVNLVGQDEDELLRICLVELLASDLTDNEVLQDGIVYFDLGLNKVQVKIDSTIAWHDHNLLVLNDLLIRGYGFTEIAGSHFLINIQDKGTRAVSLGRCDCYDFGQRGLCDHIRAVRALNQHSGARLHQLLMS